ncbi:hypothetical protein [Nocardia sp. NPDC004604]|uniref:hypothetical protein n=1 Tax=Nocardia sp. NPDC004604 TaxID=3157013 RepID=UPI0033A152B6
MRGTHKICDSGPAVVRRIHVGEAVRVLADDGGACLVADHVVDQAFDLAASSLGVAHAGHDLGGDHGGVRAARSCGDARGNTGPYGFR